MNNPRKQRERTRRLDRLVAGAICLALLFGLLPIAGNPAPILPAPALAAPPQEAFTARPAAPNACPASATGLPDVVERANFCVYYNDSNITDAQADQIADFTQAYWDRYVTALGFQTPLFTGKLSYIDFRPYWHVPLSIVQRELSADLDEPGYFDKHDYEIVGSTDLDATPLPITPENIERVRTGGLRLRQRPGPSNALGLVKFIFPNEHIKGVTNHLRTVGYQFTHGNDHTSSITCFNDRHAPGISGPKRMVLRSQSTGNTI